MIGMTTVDKEGRAKIESVILVPKDYVQVVRCKDCKYAEQCHKWIKFKGVDLDGRYHSLRFCSFGERKEDEHTSV